MGGRFCKTARKRSSSDSSKAFGATPMGAASSLVMALPSSGIGRVNITIAPWQPHSGAFAEPSAHDPGFAVAPQVSSACSGAPEEGAAFSGPWGLHKAASGARGGGSRTRTCEGVRQRIYSPPPLPLGTFPRRASEHPAFDRRTLRLAQDSKNKNLRVRLRPMLRISRPGREGLQGPNLERVL